MKRALSIVLTVLFLCVGAWCTTVTSVTKIVGPDGQPFNGTITLQLPFAGVNSSTNQLILATPVVASVINGIITQPFAVTGNDVMSPAMPYSALYTDVSGNPVTRQLYYITGATFDVGSAPATPNFLNSTVTFANNITATGNVSVGGTLGVAGATTLPSIDKRIYVDGVKYPITRAGIQSAFNDACAQTNGFGAGGTTVYLPASQVLTINGTTDANSANEIWLITCSLNVQGAGIYSTVFSIITAASSSQKVFRVKPSSVASQGAGRFTGFNITGDGTAGDGIFFDGGSIGTSTGGPHSWVVEGTYITGLSAGAHSVALGTCQVTCDQGKFVVRDNHLDHGVQFGGGSAGDSILVEHNVFSEFTGTTPCVDMNLQTGSALLTVFNNNGGCQGGFFIGHAGSQPKILYNQIEQTTATNEANSAIIDIQGDVGPIEGTAIIGNNLNAHTFATNNIRLDNAQQTTIEANVITLKVTTGVGILLTATPTATRIPWNDMINVGGGAVGISNASAKTNFAEQGPNGLASAATYGFFNCPNCGLGLTSGTPWMDVAGVIGTYWTATEVRQGSGFCVNWSSAADATANIADSGLCRIAPDVVGVGTGAAGNVTGEIRTAKISATYNAAGTVQTAVHIVQDSGTLSSGTPSTATITLAGSAVYTSNATYNCSATNKTTQANNLKISYTNGSTFVVTGPNTVTDAFSFVCVGN